MSETARTARRWPYVLPLVVLVALFGVFGKRLWDVDQGLNPQMIPSAIDGEPLPAFDLASLPGRADETRFKTDDLKGRVSVVNVWGSWCSGCLQEHPVLMKLAQESGVEINGIDWRDTPEAGLAWLKKHGDPYRHIGQDPESHAAIALGVTGAPESLLVDATGRIVFKWTWQITPEVWRKEFVPRIAQLRK